MTNCDATPETAEQYVSGTLAEAEQAAFEEHFFGCDTCFRRVQALQGVKDALGAMPAESHASAAGRTETQPARRTPPMAWMALAAMLVLSVVVWRLPWQSGGPADQPAQAPATPAPATAPAAAARSPEPAPAEDRFTRMASITPPPYVSLTTRSETDANERAFEQAMTHYAARRYDHAARGLQEIATRAPSLAHAQFFLGVSELMQGRADRARAAFERTVRTGVSPYSDEAHFYLAKAALAMKDPDAARRALRIAIDREAGPRGEAARLLGELQAIPR